LRMLELFGPLAQLDQSALDYIDVDGLAKYLLKTLSIPATTVRGDMEVQEMRSRRQEQQIAASQQQELMQLAEAAGNAAPMVRAVE